MESVVPEGRWSTGGVSHRNVKKVSRPGDGAGNGIAIELLRPYQGTHRIFIVDLDDSLLWRYCLSL